MPFTTIGRNYMLDSLTSSRSAQTLYVGLCTAAPVDGGATNEVTGTGYGRVAASFGAGSAGTRTDSGTRTITVPAGRTITHVGWWTLSSGGDLIAYDDVTSESFNAQGQYQVTNAVLTLTTS